MTALAELAASLPAWVRWGPACFYPCLALATLLPLTWLLEAWLLRPVRRLPDDTHWSERARLGFPARTRLLSWALVSTTLVAMAWVLWLGRLTPVLIAVAPALAVFVATSLTALRAGRLVAPDRPRLSVRGAVGLLALGWGQIAFVLLCVALVGDHFGARAWVVVALSALGSVAWSLGWPAALAARLGLFRPPSAELAALVDACAAQAGVTAPPVSVAELPMANAFALVPGDRLVVTRAAVVELPEVALRALLEHELVHLRAPQSLRIVRVVSSLVLSALVLARPVMGQWGVAGLAWLALAAIVVGLVLARVRVALERAALAAARATSNVSSSGSPSGPQGAAYARVLERIHELHGVPAVMRSMFAPRSSLYDRMTDAGAAPSFARPAPPPRALFPLLVCFTLALASLMGTRLLLMWAELSHGERLSVMHVVLATTGGDAHAFEQLGYARYLAGDVPGATTAYEAAAELAPDDAEPRALVARLRMMSGDCSGARGAAWDASVVADRAGNARDRALASSIRRELEQCERVARGRP